MKFGAPIIPPDSIVPKEQGWGQQILALVKMVVDDLSSILSRGIRFNEHVYGGITSIPVIAGSYPVKFKPNTREVASVWVGKIVEQSSGTAAPTAGVWCDWEYVNGVVEVSNITGLVASAKYTITFVYLGG